MRGRTPKPFGLGGDLGLSVSSTEPDRSDMGWRISGRNQSRSGLPRLGQILLAVLVVAAMAAGLHFFFY